MENSSVSMPYIGLPPFLQDKITIKFQKVKVSMPYIGLPPFLQAADDIHDASEGSVNALYRASPISTLSLQKPFKINGFRGRFQGVIVRKF